MVSRALGEAIKDRFLLPVLQPKLLQAYVSYQILKKFNLIMMVFSIQNLFIT